MNLHTNSDRSATLEGIRPLKLKKRRELQEKSTWNQLNKGDLVYPLEEATTLHRDLRQASRWPEDWIPPRIHFTWWKWQRWWPWYDDYVTSYDKSCWVICFVPKVGCKAQFRIQDLT